MKRSLVIVFSVVLLLFLVACGGNKVDESTAEQYITKAETIINLLNESNYEEVYAMFSDEMKEGFPVVAMEELTPIIEGAGNFEKIDKASVEEEKGIYVTVNVAKYSHENRMYTISFNEDEEVVGLYIK